MERGTVIGLITTRKVLFGGGLFSKEKKFFFFQFEGFEIFWYLIDNSLKYVEYLEKRREGFK